MSPEAEKVAASTAPKTKGLSLDQRFTDNSDPLENVTYELRRAVIKNPDGSVVFEMDSVEVPSTWSQLATDIVVSKYFRKAGVPGTGHEVSARQVVERVAKAIRKSGEQQGGYFKKPIDAEVFEKELTFMLINQMGAFNSPVWFNCGLNEAYGIKGKPAGCWTWYSDEETKAGDGNIRLAEGAYVRPQVSACFIQSVKDDLMDIAEGIQREMRLFKFGSGTGGNFSNLRGKGELLSGGGTSSGLLSFLDVYDKAAGAIKSGGTTRRAAKMVCVDMDHPDVMDFIDWKAREEDKALALIRAGYDPDFNGEAYRTVSGQNANNSVRASDEFLEAVERDGDWNTTWRTDGKVAKTYKARDMMKAIAKAAHRCADPGIQFSTTCNKWNTVANDEPINATNPCSEYVFIDDTACNLASVNLLKFLREDGTFDIPGYQHACRIFFLAQEILVDHASYPSEKIASRSHDYRPLGLGYANLGTLLMTMGMPYDSPEARQVAGAITAIMTGTAYATSAEMAREKGPFPAYSRNKTSCMSVMNMHRDAAHQLSTPMDPALEEAAQTAWDKVVNGVSQWGLRNAQATVLAPTGTIGLLMDCDTTGVEPEFSLVKFKKLAGGGSFKITNGSVDRALVALGYDAAQISHIIEYMRGTWSFDGAPCINRHSLQSKGLTPSEIDKAEAALPGAFELRHAFLPHAVGNELYARLGITDKASDPMFNLLEHLGFGSGEIEAAEEILCGRMTIEGAPHLKTEHLPIFDCASRCGKLGSRFIAPMGHVRMMAAAQPFLSGAISKTCNLPPETTQEEIEQLYMEAWKLGLKAVAVYRDGSKHSQILQAKSGAEGVLSDSKGTAKPKRRRLSAKRDGGDTWELKIGGQKIYLRTGEHADGTLGEIFIDMHKEGATIRSMMNTFAISISLGLQYGVRLEEYVDAFVFCRFDPAGLVVGHPNVKYATSILDLVFRLLAFEYLGRTDLVHIKPDGIKMETSDDSPVVAEAITANASDAHAASLMGDGPCCGICGHTTVRNGTCYKCLNCGNSMGCS